MIRLADGEIRHYGGGGFIFSRDHGPSYVHFQSLAEIADAEGYLVESVEASAD